MDGLCCWIRIMYRHGKSETVLKWDKDTIVNSKYRPLIRIFLEADEAVEIQRFLQLMATFVQDLVAPDRSTDPSRLKLLEGTDLFESILERWQYCRSPILPPVWDRRSAYQVGIGDRQSGTSPCNTRSDHQYRAPILL